MTHLRQIMLEELERRNYAPSTIRAYIRTVEHYSRHFHRPPDQLGLDHIREYQASNGSPQPNCWFVLHRSQTGSPHEPPTQASNRRDASASPPGLRLA